MGIVERAIVLSEAFVAQHRVELAPEPEGPKAGTVRSSDAAPLDPLRIVALGDSMVAGCGVDTTSESLIPDLANAISAMTNREVEWSINGKLGATMRRVRFRMLPQLSEEARTSDAPDILVICAGSNDIMARRSKKEWRDDLTAVVKEASALAHHVVVLSSGQLYKSPSLGHALRKEVERRIDNQTAISTEVCNQFGALYVDLTHEPLHADARDFWASDHFHPSAFGYVLIAEATAKKLEQPLLQGLSVEARSKN
ncbi:MAG: GDSL-type esterase/lipase family protein [Bifidobacteriaceae bacterium]|jgi:lysophospholipase L1-like esterase|nr:GDSL-type esterase/lipase family protein [Bifidobacteriaceae bacterium]MCI1914295.1 GDSL-type esterase/lipase family protein [Bifidobacteriaceae bacterium]